MGIIRRALTQIFPPMRHFTELQTPSLAGRFFIITGRNSGVGYELIKILYYKGGKVYIAGHSATKLATAIITIKAETTSSTVGQLNSLVFNLSNLSTIAPSTSSFLTKESHLNILFVLIK